MVAKQAFEGFSRAYAFLSICGVKVKMGPHKLSCLTCAGKSKDETKMQMHAEISNMKRKCKAWFKWAATGSARGRGRPPPLSGVETGDKRKKSEQLWCSTAELGKTCRDTKDKES